MEPHSWEGLWNCNSYQVPLVTSSSWSPTCCGSVTVQVCWGCLHCAFLLYFSVQTLWSLFYQTGQIWLFFQPFFLALPSTEPTRTALFHAKHSLQPYAWAVCPLNAFAFEVLENSSPEAPVSEPIDPTHHPKGADCFAHHFEAAWIKKQALSRWNFKTSSLVLIPRWKQCKLHVFRSKAPSTQWRAPTVTTQWHCFGGWMCSSALAHHTVPEYLVNTALLIIGIPAGLTHSPPRLALFRRWANFTLGSRAQLLMSSRQHWLTEGG